MTLQAWHTYFGQFPAFFFAGPLKLHQVGWGASVHSHFQISLRFKSGLWLGHSRTFTVPKPLLCYLGCVLRVVVLLEDEPLPQSEVQSALEQVFIKDVSVHCCITVF